jgi:cysteine desulfurase / selenocysteine lyase
MFEDIRKEFPILKQSMFGKKLVYLDSAASTQKPQAVIDRISKYYEEENANIHRGPYDLSVKGTELWEEAHQTVADFINADSYKEIIFVRNTTEGLNLLVNIFGRDLLSKDDIVVVTEMEHHSNIVSWMLLQKQIPFQIEYMPVNDDYTLDLDWLRDLIKKHGKRVKIVSVVHISNVLGIKNNVEEIFNIAKEVEAFTILDAAQSIVHTKVDVKEIGCDALVFSGHKAYAPTGSGAVYCKEKYLEKATPWMGGGEMISEVSFDSFKYNELPWKFEAGTPDIGGGIVLGYTLEWFEKTLEKVGGWDSLIKHEQELIEYFFNQFKGIDWFKPFGPTDSSLKYGAIAFNIEGFTFRGCKDSKSIKNKKSGSEISQLMNNNGIAFREGYHCAEPLHDRFSNGPTLRFSLAIYNNKDEMKYAANILKQAVLSGLR